MYEFIGAFIDVLVIFYLIRLIIFKVFPFEDKYKLVITIIISFPIIFILRLSYVFHISTYFTLAFYLTFVFIEIKYIYKPKEG